MPGSRREMIDVEFSARQHITRRLQQRSNSGSRVGCDIIGPSE
jgi:hypothetical protein